MYKQAMHINITLYNLHFPLCSVPPPLKRDARYIIPDLRLDTIKRDFAPLQCSQIDPRQSLFILHRRLCQTPRKRDMEAMRVVTHCRG